MNDQINNPRKLYVLLSVLAPILIMSVYLIVSRWLMDEYAKYDFLFIVISIAIGAWFITKSSLIIANKSLTFFLYVPIIFGVLFIYATNFVCYVFGDCL